ncbi:MAG TPA: restriction endonuclease subunit S [Agitococcus sp.]|nr:restriction endonuclease subunit S [Agitococcus sp.]
MNNIKFIEGIGFIPNDWAVKKADELCSKITKGTTPPKEDIVNNSHIPFLRVNNLTFDGVLDVNSGFIFVSEAAHRSVLSRSIAYKNDILMNIVGPPLGKTALLNDNFDEYNLNQAIVIYRVSSVDVARLFFFFFLKSVIAQNWLQSHSKKTSGQQNLTIEVCKNLPIPIPPLPEQIKIAEILSTWDNAINTVQKLLTNSQQQKKALMQQLLTGKKRFAGFEGEWEEKRLGDVCTPQQWPTISSKDLVNNGYSVYGANGFIGYYFEYNHKNETVAVTCRGSTCGEVSLIPEKSYITGNSMCLDDINEKKYAYRYLYYFLKNRGFNDVISGSAQPQIVGSAIRKVKVLIPSLPEQQKIAAVLTTADQEIDNLHAQLSRLEKEKKALMQQLLTGKRRVKVEEAA